MAVGLVVGADVTGRFFDLNPSPTFIVDQDVTLLALNPAAARLLGRSPEQVLAQVHLRAGEVLRCSNASKTPRGCGGASECRSCILRKTVTHLPPGGSVQRRLARLKVQRDGQEVDFACHVSATPFEQEGRQLYLLILEDVTDLVMIGQLVSMCAWCGKVRLDDRFWGSVEELLRARLNAEVTHGICDACCGERFPEAVDEKA